MKKFLLVLSIAAIMAQPANASLLGGLKKVLLVPIDLVQEFGAEVRECVFCGWKYGWI